MIKYILFFIAMVFSLQASAASACLCMEMTQERSLEIIDQAELIFKGRIVMLETQEQPMENFDYDNAPPVPENALYSKARLKIIDLYKGTPEGNRFTAYIDMATSCGAYFELGDVSNFILNRHEEDDVLVQADSCNMPLPTHQEDLQNGIFKGQE